MNSQFWFEHSPIENFNSKTCLSAKIHNVDSTKETMTPTETISIFVHQISTVPT